MYVFQKLTFALAFGAAALCAQSISTLAVETTGMVGLAEGQTARLNVLNVGVMAPAMSTLCTVTVTYFDNTGTSLKSGTVTVVPNQSQSVDLRADADLNLTAGERREIRAEISMQNSCKAVGTLELFDTTSGRTQTIVGSTVTIPSVVAASNGKN